VHPVQVVDELPREATDVAVSLVVTPEETIEIDDPPPAPDGIDWTELSEERVDEMPILEQLRDR
jgi:5-formyltetrahydrofolate cyclo-ligase